MLNSLRFHFPDDYNRHQQTRESSLQRAIQRVLSTTVTDLAFQPNVVFRAHGRTLTDVDLVVAERTTGCVVLCQLKHQELHGADLHAKRIRADRLRNEATRWLSTVGDFLCSVGDDELQSVLRLPTDFPRPTVFRAVISRHSSAAVKGVVDDALTVFSSWPQFVNAVGLLTATGRDRTLFALMGVLMEMNRLEEQHYRPESSAHWSINRVSFSVRHRNDLSVDDPSA